MTSRTLQKSVALLACLILLPFVPAHAQVESATVVVEGMSCPFCAFGVEKRLKKVRGVGSIEVNMGVGSASMTASEGESIDFSRDCGLSRCRHPITRGEDVLRDLSPLGLVAPS